MDIWTACVKVVTPAPLRGELVRLVESQIQAATHALVDTLEEQALLEGLLDASKPGLRAGTEGLHYLLATPFRYPPLLHGSRFGRRHEPSLFYGSKGPPAALAETAYYRFVFWSGMRLPPPVGRLTTGHTLFGARYQVKRGLVLHHPALKRCSAALTDPRDYSATQSLGTRMREAGVEAFEYRSARDPARGINIALFQPPGPGPCDTPLATAVVVRHACRRGLVLQQGARRLQLSQDPFPDKRRATHSRCLSLRYHPHQHREIPLLIEGFQ